MTGGVHHSTTIFCFLLLRTCLKKQDEVLVMVILKSIFLNQILEILVSISLHFCPFQKSDFINNNLIKLFSYSRVIC